MSEENNYIGINIEPAVKKKFKELCDERGSNMTVELRRYIYSELKKADK
jgi:hypothetical protein